MLAFLSFLVFLQSGCAWYADPEQYRYVAQELIPLDKLVDGIRSARGQSFTFDANFLTSYCSKHLLCAQALWEVCNNGGGTCTVQRKSSTKNGRRAATCTVRISGCSSSPQYPKKSYQQIVDDMKSSKESNVDVNFHVDTPEDCFHSKFCGNPSFLEEVNPLGGGYCNVQLKSKFSNIPPPDNQHACQVRIFRYQLPANWNIEGLSFLTAQDVQAKASRNMNKETRVQFKVKERSDCESMCQDIKCPGGEYCNSGTAEYKNLNVCEMVVYCLDSDRRRSQFPSLAKKTRRRSASHLKILQSRKG